LWSGQEALGERLLILMDGPIDVGDASGATLGLDRFGSTVSVVAAPEASDTLPQELADHLARIATLPDAELARMAGMSPEGLNRLHAEMFAREGDTEPRFNDDQRVIVLLGAEPSRASWAGFASELGSRLAGVYVVRDGVLDPLGGGRAALRPSSSLAAFLRSRWGTATIAAVVAATLAVAFTGGFRAAESQLPVIEGFVSTIALGVPGDATHTQWVGQHHIVRTSDDRLHVLYASAGRLHIVTDHANGGRSWEQPVAVPEIRTTAFSATVDTRDRLLLAYTDDRQLRFTTLMKQDAGWVPGEALILDTDSVSRVVDVAWDPASAVAHVVWAAGEGAGERPQWAAVAVEGQPHVIESRSLAPAGGTAGVLISVVVAPDSEVLAAYRRADQGGFYSRTARPRGSTTFVWGPEEALPTDASFGAESLVVDEEGTVHLALRNDVDPSILYFRRPPGEPWGAGEVAVAAPSSVEVDFPALSVDERSDLVFLFFQNAAVEPSPQIRVLVRDPAVGWLGSFAIINPAAVPDGANFPIAAGTVTGSASVLWTRKGPVPDIQIARFVAP
jgi:hypothetical protein